MFELVSLTYQSHLGISLLCKRIAFTVGLVFLNCFIFSASHYQSNMRSD